MWITNGVKRCNNKLEKKEIVFIQFIPFDPTFSGKPMTWHDHLQPRKFIFLITNKSFEILPSFGRICEIITGTCETIHKISNACGFEGNCYC